MQCEQERSCPIPAAIREPDGKRVCRSHHDMYYVWPEVFMIANPGEQDRCSLRDHPHAHGIKGQGE